MNHNILSSLKIFAVRNYRDAILITISSLAGWFVSFIDRETSSVSCTTAQMATLDDLFGESSGLIIENVKTGIKTVPQSCEVRHVLFKNSGRRHITPADVDPRDTLGFKIVDAVIIGSPKVISASSERLRQKINMTQPGDIDFSVFGGASSKYSPTNTLGRFSEIRFDPMMLDSGEWFEVRFLLARDLKRSPTFTALGKVSGIDCLSMTNVETTLSSKDSKAMESWIATTITPLLTVLAITLAAVICYKEYYAKKAISRKNNIAASEKADANLL